MRAYTSEETTEESLNNKLSADELEQTKRSTFPPRPPGETVSQTSAREILLGSCAPKLPSQANRRAASHGKHDAFERSTKYGEFRPSFDQLILQLPFAAVAAAITSEIGGCIRRSGSNSRRKD